MRTCSVDTCERKHYGRGYCGAHYRQWYKHGSVQTVEIARPVAYYSSERERKLLKKYGISQKVYDGMLAMQDFRCRVCPLEVAPGSIELDVDHDHVSGRVRGLLCRRCNLLLGVVHENPTILRSAAFYLECA